MKQFVFIFMLTSFAISSCGHFRVARTIVRGESQNGAFKEKSGPNPNSGNSTPTVSQPSGSSKSGNQNTIEIGGQTQSMKNTSMKEDWLVHDIVIKFAAGFFAFMIFAALLPFLTPAGALLVASAFYSFITLSPRSGYNLIASKIEVDASNTMTIAPYVIASAVGALNNPSLDLHGYTKTFLLSKILHAVFKNLSDPNLSDLSVSAKMELDRRLVAAALESLVQAQIGIIEGGSVVAAGALSGLRASSQLQSERLHDLVHVVLTFSKNLPVASMKLLANELSGKAIAELKATGTVAQEEILNLAEEIVEAVAEGVKTLSISEQEKREIAEAAKISCANSLKEAGYDQAAIDQKIATLDQKIDAKLNETEQNLNVKIAEAQKKIDETKNSLQQIFGTAE